MRAYLSELAKAKYNKRLTAVEEVELATKAKSGDISARNQLIERNLPFALSIAKKFVTTSVSIEELLSAANVGLIKAADKYDPTIGVKFITFAVHQIRAAVMEELNNRHLVHTPYGRNKATVNSIDQAVPGTDDLYLYETLQYDGDQADTVLVKDDLKSRLYQLLDKYDQRTKDVMDVYFNLYTPYTTMEDICKKYNVSSERLRNIKINTLNELKNSY